MESAAARVPNRSPDYLRFLWPFALPQPVLAAWSELIALAHRDGTWRMIDSGLVAVGILLFGELVGLPRWTAVIAPIAGAAIMLRRPPSGTVAEPAAATPAGRRPVPPSVGWRGFGMLLVAVLAVGVSWRQHATLSRLSRGVRSHLAATADQPRETGSTPPARVDSTQAADPAASVPAPALTPAFAERLAAPQAGPVYLPEPVASTVPAPTATATSSKPAEPIVVAAAAPAAGVAPTAKPLANAVPSTGPTATSFPYPAEPGVYALSHGRWVRLPTVETQVGERSGDGARGALDSPGTLPSSLAQRMADLPVGRVTNLVLDAPTEGPIVRAGDLVVAAVGAAPPTAGGERRTGWQYVPTIELAVAKRAPNGTRIAALVRLAPDRFTFGPERMPAAVAEPQPGVTILRCAQLPPGTYAIRSGDQLYSLVTQ